MSPSRHHPCDFCRKRKTACVVNGEPPCTTCAKRGLSCYFSVRIPRQNRKIRKRDQIQFYHPGTNSFSGEPANTTLVEPEPEAEPIVETPKFSPQTAFDLPFAVDLWNTLFNELYEERLDPDLSRRFQDRSPEQMRRFVSTSLDADHTVKAVYLNGESYLDPSVFSRVHGQIAGSLDAEKPQVYVKSLQSGPDSPLMLVRQDSDSSKKEAAVRDRILALVGDFGPHLLLLFFRKICPFLPLFSHSLFRYGKNKDMMNFRQAHTAVLLSVAMDWWNSDEVLAQSARPPSAELLDIACAKIMDEQETPNLSTLQTCVLFTQKRPDDCRLPDTPLKWSILGMASSMITLMGYNQDCSKWDIPDWNVRIRRRVWWTFVVQDTWFAVCYGRPLHIGKKNWHVPSPTKRDFGAQCSAEDVKSFCFLARLSSLVADISEELLLRESSFETAQEIGRLLLRQIKTLELDCPQSTGSIPLAIHTAKLVVWKRLVHLSNEQAVIRGAVEAFRMAVSFIVTLPTHGFWYSWSRLNFALVATFGMLLYTRDNSVKEIVDQYRRWLCSHSDQLPELLLAQSLLENTYSSLIT